ncbi:MAG TPA: phosphoenolpyruvate--protein phosphotransferase [Candidatus Polarisedimenticolaceae bacterium]|nr:phosphoenolpyruvate--protein phosphotransferase [Candidatus Polarisedimenticolaceae bacterium]
MERVLRGLGVSGGVAVGWVHLLHADALPVVPEPIPPERVAEEVERFHRARRAARAELKDLRARVLRVLGERYAGILDAQLLILDDPSLVEPTQQHIRLGRVSARWALAEAVAELGRRFDVVEDPYLRERGGDLSDVHRRLQRRLRGPRPNDGRALQGPLVAVAPALGISDVLALSRRGVVGLALDGGGPTAHSTILARTLGLPTVVGLVELSRWACEGDAVIVDGQRGEVTLHAEQATQQGAAARRRDWLEREAAMVAERELPAVTADGTEVTLRANVELPGEVEAAVRYGARGVGLCRSELLFLGSGTQLADEQAHHDAYVQIGEAVAPHPAVIRTLDLPGEAAGPSLRGIRLWLRRPDLLRPQLRALLRAAARADLRILLPLVTTAEELEEARRWIRQEAEQLRAAGTAVREDVPLGAMIEVPAAAVAADVLAARADFFSIGTNDLIQYALAVDRSDGAVGQLYQPLHPGVLRLLRGVVECARPRALPVALCGEMAADPLLVPVLIGLGLRELSVRPGAIAEVRGAIRGARLEDAVRRAKLAVGPGDTNEAA